MNGGVVRAKENGELLHISFRERTGRASSQTGNRKALQLGKLGATYWTPAGYCKAAEVNKQAVHIHTSHFEKHYLIPTTSAVHQTQAEQFWIGASISKKIFFDSFLFSLPQCSGLRVLPINLAFLWTVYRGWGLLNQSREITRNFLHQLRPTAGNLRVRQSNH